MSKKNKLEVLTPLTIEQEKLLSDLQNAKYLRLENQEDIANFYVLVKHEVAYAELTECKQDSNKVSYISAVVAKAVYRPEKIQYKMNYYPVGTKVRTKRHRHGYTEIIGVVKYVTERGQYGIENSENVVYECRHKDLIVIN